MASRREAMKLRIESQGIKRIGSCRIDTQKFGLFVRDAMLADDAIRRDAEQHILQAQQTRNVRAEPADLENLLRIFQGPCMDLAVTRSAEHTLAGAGEGHGEDRLRMAVVGFIQLQPSVVNSRAVLSRLALAKFFPSGAKFRPNTQSA